MQETLEDAEGNAVATTTQSFETGTQVTQPKCLITLIPVGSYVCQETAAYALDERRSRLILVLDLDTLVLDLAVRFYSFSLSILVLELAY